jgi:hypothetical protein
MMRMRRALAAAFCASVIGAPLTGAAASSAAGAPPSGFRSTGTLVVQATISGSPLNVGGTIAFYERGNLYRLDLLSLGFPGSDPTASAVAGALLAPGGVTLIYDGSTGAIAAYSIGNRTVYRDRPKAPGPAPVGPPALTGAADPLAALSAVARQLHDVERASIALTGHSTTNGHPTDDLDVVVVRQRPGKSRENYHAQVSLADDLDGFPVRIALQSTPPTPQDFGGALRLDLTAVARESPADSVFAVPDGLTPVSSLGEVLAVRS